MSKKITDPYDGYETRYPKLLEISNTQLEKNLWFASKIRVVEEDRMEMLYSLTEEQRNVVKQILPMFRKYEVDVSDFWTDVYPKFFLAPECKEGAAVINMVERAVHARFYDKINKVFGTDTDEHYLSYLDDPIFKGRAKWLGETLRGKDKKLTCLVFGLTEGVSLFCMFALLRSFQANGHNDIETTVKGTKQSAVDELSHSEYLAASFNYYYAEKGSSLDQDEYYYNALLEQTYSVVENEKFILRQLVPSGVFNSVPLEDYFELIEQLANLYFERMFSKRLPFKKKECKLLDWFMTATVGYAEADFFRKGEGKEYEMGWNPERFSSCWSKK